MVFKHPTVFTTGLFLCCLSAVFIGMAAVHAYLHGWILITGPVTNTGHQVNSMLGYSYLYAGDVIHRENVPFVDLALSFSGLTSLPHFYSLRAVYPFLTGIVALVVEFKRAGLFVNALAVSALMFCTGWIAFEITRDRLAAVVAAALYLTGVGVVVHLTDISAHLLGHATYAIATCYIYHSKVWETKQPLIVHLTIGVILAISCLTYTSGIIGVAAYVLVAVWRSNPLHVGLAAAIAAAIRPLWQLLLTVSYQTWFAHLGPVDFSVERVRAALALQRWIGLFVASWSTGLETVAVAALDGIFCAFPVIIIAGLLSLTFYAATLKARYLFFVPFALGPFAGMLFYATGGPARGYIAYSGAFILFAFAVAAIWRMRVAGIISRRIYGIVCALTVIAQLSWSFAHVFEYYFPITSYFIGASNASSAFSRTDVFNLSGSYPLWSM